MLIKNEGNGQYLDVTENDAKPGKPVQTYARNGQENQQWRAEAHLDGSISLRSVANSSLCATAERGTDGYILRLQPCSGRDSQKFHPSLVDEQFALLESHAYRDQALAAKGNNNPATLAKTDPTDKKQHWSAEEVTN
ncbi:RICIN domain-containing protein [Streptomyces thermolilacinus]|uniref:RICIN domain-containing protein n=1 Tax=Streptomyces thermolilacinus TaxID=285540 RepID=UPI0033D5F6AE